MPILKSITGITKILRVCTIFEEAVSKIRDVCMDFEPDFKVHNLVSVYPKSIILDQMIQLNMIFHMVESFIDMFKFETRPSLLNFGRANSAVLIVEVSVPYQSSCCPRSPCGGFYDHFGLHSKEGSCFACKESKLSTFGEYCEFVFEAKVSFE